jgi:hypothetical protein
MTAQVQFMITNAMKATLVDELEFKPEEVDVMRPEIAAELIEKNMKRPFGDRPMPDQWKRDYDGGTGGGGRTTIRFRAGWRFIPEFVLHDLSRRVLSRRRVRRVARGEKGSQKDVQRSQEGRETRDERTETEKAETGERLRGAVHRGARRAE